MEKKRNILVYPQQHPITSNQAKKLLWQTQVDADKIDAEAVCQQEDEVHMLRETKVLKDKDNLCKEEHKKNQAKILPIPNCPVPQRAPVIATQFSIQWIDKGDCVPLWYYTNKGLENALVTYNLVDNDALTLLCRPNGSTSLIPVSSTKTVTLNGRISALWHHG